MQIIYSFSPSSNEKCSNIEIIRKKRRKKSGGKWLKRINRNKIRQASWPYWLWIKEDKECDTDNRKYKEDNKKLHKSWGCVVRVGLIKKVRILQIFWYIIFMFFLILCGKLNYQVGLIYYKPCALQIKKTDTFFVHFWIIMCI